MGADVHIHILEGIEEQDLAEFFSNSLGSKHFDLTSRHSTDSYARVAETPQVFIGEASFLRAFVSGDADGFVPKTVQKIQELIGEDLPVLDDKLIADILAAFELEHETPHTLGTISAVAVFLEEHKGKKVFTVAW